MVADDRPKIEGVSLTVYLQMVNVGAQRDGLEQAVGIAARAEGLGYWGCLNSPEPHFLIGRGDWGE
jgi:hypothetical protein